MCSEIRQVNCVGQAFDFWNPFVSFRFMISEWKGRPEYDQKYVLVLDRMRDFFNQVNDPT